MDNQKKLLINLLGDIKLERINSVKKCMLFVIFLLLSSQIFAQTNIIKIGKDYAFSDRIVVKLNIASSTLNKFNLMIPANILNKFQKLGITKITKRFNKLRYFDNSAVQLNKIVIMKYSSPVNPLYMASKISHISNVQWAEPYYLGQMLFSPDDALYSKQYALRKISAEEAWNITKGDSTIIAIVDTGVDWKHPDLRANIWTNPGEIPNNGIDDDHNGYIDDVHGWDFGGFNGTSDNNPMEDRPDHGTHVAGIASAVTNNNIGVASIGFNSTIMPVKVSQDNIRTKKGEALIVYGFKGITYAVDNGAKVINCSWGNYSYSNTEQSVINYVVAHGALLVGAAGNDSQEKVIYPAGYNGALAVGATDSSDKIVYFSNYGHGIDVMAPGLNIESTWQPNTYASLSGTSMASPLVAGLAALVFSRFPNYTPGQVAEQIRVNADDITTLNPSYAYLLGSGRINAYKAVTDTNSESVRLTNVKFIDKGNGNGVFEAGEKVQVDLNFKNYLAPTNNLLIQFVTNSPYATVDKGSFNAGAVGTLSTFNNNSSPFEFLIGKNVPYNQTISFLIKYSDGNYSGFQWINVLVNPSYRTQNGNTISLTITSKGNLGFNDYPENLQGDGFKYNNGPDLLFEGALMYGTSSNKLPDAARGSNADKQDADFNVIKPLYIETPGKVADVQGDNIFNDDSAGTSKLGITTELKSYTYFNAPNNHYIILQYLFTNKSGTDIKGFYAGLFFDWDIDATDYDKNIVAYDSLGGFGYAYDQNLTHINTYIGMALLLKGNYGIYAITNDGSDGGIDIYDGFTKSGKWTALTNGIKHAAAGPSDISAVVSSGPYNISANGSIDVAFAIAADTSITALREAVKDAKKKFGWILRDVPNNKIIVPVKFELYQNYPNPFNPTTTIEYSIPTVETRHALSVQLKIYDILGREVAELVNEKQAAGNYSVQFNAANLSSGVYFYRIKAGNFVQTKKMVLIK